MSRLLILFFVIAFGTLGCKKMPIYQPKPMADVNIDPRDGYYNADNKLLYSIYEKQDSLVLYVATAHLPSQVKIMRLGFHVWFDQQGKRNKDLGIYYPQLNPETLPNQGRGGVATSEFDQKKSDKDFGIKKELIEIGFKRPGSYRAYNLALEKPHVSATLKREGIEMISYRLAIPKSYVLTSMNEDSVVSVGLISGNLDPPSVSDPSPSMNPMMGQPQQQGMQPGMQPGMPNQRQGGMMPQQGMPQSRDLNQMRGVLLEPITIWFKVDLNTSRN